MAKQLKTGHLVTRVRRERGTPLPITKHKITLANGETAEYHGINLTEAEVPDRSYWGAGGGAKYENDALVMWFGQPKLGGGLRSLVIITMNPQAAAQLTHSLNGMREPTLAK